MRYTASCDPYGFLAASMLSGYDALPAGAPEAVVWSARARLSEGAARVYVRDHTLTFSEPASFRPSGAGAPAALDGLLAAVAAELVTGLSRAAARRGLILDACEARVSAHLENPLLAAGVVGEEGSPALARLDAALFVATPEPEETIRTALGSALRGAPVWATLSRACPAQLTLKITL